MTSRQSWGFGPHDPQSPHQRLGLSERAMSPHLTRDFPMANPSSRKSGLLTALSRVLFSLALVLAPAACDLGEGPDGAADGAEARQIWAGTVSAASPEAAEAGRRILEAGGNAVDAAVAVSMALSVTEPAGSGIAGQTVLLIRKPDGEAVVVQGSSRAPGVLPPDAHPERLEGHQLTTVPTTLRTLDRAWREFGSGAVGWDELLAPAIHWAEEGFELRGFRHAAVERFAQELSVDPLVAGIFLDETGRPLPEGSLVRQPILARTLRRLAEAGAQDFYTGEVAAAIAREMAERGGWVTAEDLAGVADPPLVAPLRARYRHLDVITLPPPYGGWIVLQALSYLDLLPPDSLAPGEPGRDLRVAEALRLAHTTRARDPVPNPLDYEEAVAERIDPERARLHRAALLRERGGETTHFTVVDSDGMVVAGTESINSYFGARVAGDELGILWNSYMIEFQDPELEHPFALRPGAFPLSSMSATIVADADGALLGLGSPGSARIISAVTQITSLVLDAGLTVEEAVAHPRVHVVPGPEDGPDLLYLEREEGAPDSSVLGGLGFRFTPSDGGVLVGRGWGGAGFDPYFGGVHAVARVREPGPDAPPWAGAADPRRDGAAVHAWVPERP